MPTKKNAAAKEDGASASNSTSASASPLTAPSDAKKAPKAKAPPPQPSSSALIICRNKHWRYISAFHGPWLQLPPEILEALANTNYNTPRPRPIDPAVFFDLVKIRRLVDEATNIAVRAATGVAATYQHFNASSAALGLGGPGTHTKLSRERKHRMREQATQKLAKAYYLDEIATSVAIMQGASTLEEVANLVLQRNAQDPDAKYVHFFHEKIPSRHLAECTKLDVLDEIIAARPTDGEPLRTRATVRVFKEDFKGAVADLTEALKVHRLYRSPHTEPKSAVQQGKIYERIDQARKFEDVILKEEDQPSSLEMQLLFQRAGVYLTLASQHVEASFTDEASPTEARDSDLAATPDVQKEDTKESGADASSEPEETAAQKEAEKRMIEARKLVRNNAKRALRDYMAFLSHFEYSPDLPLPVAEEFSRKVNYAANGVRAPRKPGSPVPGEGVESRAPQRIYALSELFAATPPSDLPPYPSTELTVARPQQPTSPNLSQTTTETLTYHPLLADALHALLLCHCLIQTSAKELLRHAYMVARLARLADGYPVFQASRSPARTDWLEVLRAGDNWIQLAGTWEQLCAPAPLPFFQQSNGGSPVPISFDPNTASAKQPKALALAAAGQKALTGPDADVVRGLARVKAPGRSSIEPEEQWRERMQRRAFMEALSDDRVGDEASFQRAVKARQLRAEREYRLDIAAHKLDAQIARDRADGPPKLLTGSESPASDDQNDTGTAASRNSNEAGTAASQSSTAPTVTAVAPARRWAPEDKDYPIASDRAAAIAHWVIEAPPHAGAASGGEGARKRKKKPAKKASS
ncbi:putative histidine kinase [Podospora aff. communis PSN243]|uniref:Histidine kinase n=1 Tax=Podospora aff. communis PSN243 TaxID=3040156 RepID=A0AAV9H1S3_9PEZI|nr:putative histidine kinase [Podospora aff. communis PSN243]